VDLGGGIYNVTGFHADYPIGCAWMQLYEGKKRWYLLPSDSEIPSGWINADHVFLSEANIAQGRKLGLVVLEIEAGDLLYFPCGWYHEVHNLTPGTVGLANAVSWPEKKKANKKNPTNILGKRTLGENPNLAAFQLISARASKKQRDLDDAFNRAILVGADFPHSQDSSESKTSEKGVIEGGVKYAAIPQAELERLRDVEKT
jgi:hypothetical protein